MASEKILTGVKHIYYYAWNNTLNTVSIDDENKLELKSVIADSVSITQEDPETNAIDCETRDEPIIESIKLGNYTVEMESADINYDILESCIGFTKVGTVAAAAPASYVKKYACIVIELEGTKLVMPRALLGSKIDASSLKTEVCKGALQGTGYSAKVKVGSETAIETPFLVMDANATFTVEAL